MTEQLDSLRFQLDQLRKDKIIYAVEAAACSATCILIVLAIALLWPGQVQHGWAGIAIGIVALGGVGYEVYAAIGNSFRYANVQSLTKQLSTLTKE